MPMIDELIVRPAREEDIAPIVAFSAAMAIETEGRTLDEGRLREGTIALLASPTHGFFMVAEVAGTDRLELVGQLMITYEWSDWRNAVFWWIQSVYVAPAWRRQGIYRRMHREVVHLAKSRGNVCGVRLYVERSNTVAQSVYKRVGLFPSAYEVYEEDFVLGRKHTPSDTSER